MIAGADSGSHVTFRDRAFPIESNFRLTLLADESYQPSAIGITRRLTLRRIALPLLSTCCPELLVRL
jgi:hypothetical protein